MRFDELKEGMNLWMDRTEEYVYPDDKYFAYFENIIITGIDEERYNVILLTRQSIFVYGYVKDQGYESELAKEFLGSVSGDNELEMRKEQWDGSWSTMETFDREEAKRRSIKYSFRNAE